MSFEKNASEKKYCCTKCNAVVASDSPDLPAACPDCGENDWNLVSDDHDVGFKESPIDRHSTT